MGRKEPKKRNPQDRLNNVLEVSLGFTDEEAKEEATRCLNCKNPACVKGCPVNIDIPEFIQLIKEGKRKEALLKIKEKNTLPAICGRVCPQEEQCEKLCILAKNNQPINIGALERYAADYELLFGSLDSKKKDTSPVKVAVVGSGPAGLSCAGELAKMGYMVVIFESLHKAGGVLTYGIPEFRLPKRIVEHEIDYIKSLGVEIRLDTLIGLTYTINDLFNEDFKAIFVATGAGLPQFLGIEGENINRVYSANEFLTRINLMQAHKFPQYNTPISLGKTVAVIGGGNVALDCARVAKRLGKEVILIYRRTEKEMPARIEEIKNAKEENIQFLFLTQPVRILADEESKVKAIECIKMRLGPLDDTGRQKPIPIEGSNFIINVDTVIVAIGQNPNPLIPRLTPELKTNPDGTIIVDENLATSIKGVFAGGDIVTGSDTVISAMGAGKRAAYFIDRYIKNEH
ncbi:MAG: NADPH-dependent glutamate synthase [Candidatus Omnitrophica bacterium]|nr:NADPH-dependent glutamate synthase [Candidatus Omnitrophota bacterium]